MKKINDNLQAKVYKLVPINQVYYRVTLPVRK